MSHALGRAPLGLLPPVWFLLALVTLSLLHWFVPVVQLLTWQTRGMGSLPLVIGVAVSVCGAMRFKRHGTTVKPFQPATRLVTDGLYRFTRNPMYLGMVLILVGLALLLGSASPWLVVIGFQQWMRWMFIQPEERIMAEQFGKAYAVYRSRVRRWL